MNKLFMAAMFVAVGVLSSCGLAGPEADLPVCGSPEHISMQAFENDSVEEFITLKGGAVIPSGDVPLTVPCVVEPPEDCVGSECVPTVCTVDCLPEVCTENCEPVCTVDCEPVVEEVCSMPITASDRAEDASGKERCKDVGTNYETETDDRHDNSVKEDTDTEINPDGDEDDATDGETSTPPNNNPNAAFNR